MSSEVLFEKVKRVVFNGDGLIVVYVGDFASFERLHERIMHSTTICVKTNLFGTTQYWEIPTSRVVLSLETEKEGSA